MSDETPPALLPRLMRHPVVVGPVVLSVQAATPIPRIPVEAYRGELILEIDAEVTTSRDFTWTQAGIPIETVDPARVRLTQLTVNDTNLYYATWTDEHGVAQRSQSVQVVVYPGHQMANQSVRAWARPDQPVVAGFVVERSLGPVRTRRFLIRVIGPSLAKFEVATPLAHPVIQFSRRQQPCLELLDTDPAAVQASSIAVGAFALDAAAGDFAATASLAPGAYTVTAAAPADSAGGEVLIEIYETRL